MAIADTSELVIVPTISYFVDSKRSLSTVVSTSRTVARCEKKKKKKKKKKMER
jgi:hypothetical protein